MTDPLYTQAPKPKRNMKPFIFIAILAIVIVVGALILGGGLPIFSASTPNDPSTPQGSGLVVDPNAADDKYVAPEKPIEPGVAIPGFSSITVPAYTTTIQGINLHNPIENDGYYYLTYKISLLDGNGEVSETLYESQLLPPGKYLQNIELSRGLAPGSYKAVMFVQPYRIADQTPTNNANFKLTINVQ